MTTAAGAIGAAAGGAAAQNLTSLVHHQLVDLVTHIKEASLNGMIGVANDTKYGLQFRSVEYWQGTIASNPGIPSHILPHDRKKNDLMIPLRNYGLNGVFAIMGYDICNVDTSEPEEFRKWKRTGTVLALGMLIYSADIGNSKFYVKGYKEADWQNATWAQLFHDMDYNPSSKGTQPFNVDLGNGITAWCNSFQDVHPSQRANEPVRTMAFQVDLRD